VECDGALPDATFVVPNRISLNQCHAILSFPLLANALGTAVQSSQMVRYRALTAYQLFLASA
jgi:hypothetical protein